MEMKNTGVVFVLLLLAATLSGCLSGSEEGDAGEATEDEVGGSGNGVSLEDLTTCLWPFSGAEVVSCEARIPVASPRPTSGETAASCVAEFPGGSGTVGARIVATENDTALQYWAPESTHGVSGVVAISSDEGYGYISWNHGNTTAEVVLPPLAPGQETVVFFFRNWIETGQPIFNDMTFRVDWEFRDDDPWPVRVIETPEEEYYLIPAMPLGGDRAFPYQWQDFMEVQGNDFHWFIGFERLLEDTVTVPTDGGHAC